MPNRSVILINYPVNKINDNTVDYTDIRVPTHDDNY